MEKSKNIEEYDILRVFVTLLVLIGHCTSCQISTAYGNANYSLLFSNGGSFFFKMSRLLTAFIYTFHMPAFFALSGAIFVLTLKKHISFKMLLEKKSKRLLLPFFIVSLVYNVPLKFIAHYFDNGKTLLFNVLFGQIFIQGNTYLWFLPVLFCLFIIFYFLKKIIKSTKVILVIFMICYCFSKCCSIQLFSYILQYGVWFTLGYLFEERRLNINCVIERKRIVILFVPSACITIVFFIVYRFLLKYYNYIDWLINAILFIIPFFAVFCMYLICIYLKERNICNNKVFNMLLNDSFGIYLYSDPWNYVLLFAGAKILGAVLFQNNYIYLLFYGIRIVFTFAISIMVTSVLKKIYEVTEIKIIKYLF